ncbi:transcriptional repressor gene korB [Roseateles sp. GG27B]
MTAVTMKIPYPAKKAFTKPDARPQALGLGLDSIGNLSDLLNDPVPIAGSSGPLQLPIDLIDEDPNQPRREGSTGFSPESLGELAETIRQRGVKTPISVRGNPEAEGRFLINHGARRYRSSKLAGKTTIPGFVDNDYNEADQVIENLQRNDLSAREIADYIGRELAKGLKRGDIAKSIGKSPAFVTQHAALLDLPDAIATVFNNGRCRDVTVINELVTASKKRSVEVAEWLADLDQEITRGSVKLLREFFDDKQRREEEGYDEPSDQADLEGGAVLESEPVGKVKEEKQPNPNKLKKAIIQVTHNHRQARLQLGRRPSADGFAWLKYEDDGHEFEADLSSVQLVAVLEG